MNQHLETQQAQAVFSLRDYAAVLRLRKWSVILVTLLVVAGALGFSFLMTPLYTSQARVLVDPPDLEGGSVSVVPNLETERELVASAAVADIVAENVGYDGGLEELLEDLSVTVPAGTEILEIEYEHADPAQSRQLAQGFVEAYLTFRREQAVDELLSASESVQARLEGVQEQLAGINAQLAQEPTPAERVTLEAEAATLAGQVALLQQQLSELAPQANLRVGEIVEPADLPTESSSPNLLLNGALALFLGLALGIGLAFLSERLDDSLRGRGDLEERVGVPVLAVVPRVPSWRKKQQARAVTLEEPKSAASESFRTLRTGVLFIANQRQMRTIMISSPSAGEGKSATTVNLGVSLAQAGKRVILVSADLRRPRLHRFFEVENGRGLTDVLSGQAGADSLVDPGVHGLRVMPSGPVPGNPAELLGSDQMGNLLEELKQAADFVLVDSPPVLVVADALTMASMVDGVLLVADAENTTRSAVLHARRELEQVNAPLIGAILNRFDPSKSHTYPYYYEYRYSYSESDGERKRKARKRDPEAEHRTWST